MSKGVEVNVKVAPYVGAWIETHLFQMFRRFHRSHPTWVRGLKLVENFRTQVNDTRSHPTWVRGLKHLHHR